MVEATFRFYAELNDFLAPGLRYTFFPHRFGPTDTIKHIAESLGVPHIELGRVLVNGETVATGYQPRAGDRVELHPAPYIWDGVPQFVLDSHLGRLAAFLRMLGFDVWYRTHAPDRLLAEISAAESRILLSRDVGLLMRKQITRGYCVRTTDPEEQLREITARFRLLPHLHPFTRCMSCNGALRRVPKEAVLDALPPRTRDFYDEFAQCEACAKVYWKGSHYDRMSARINALLLAKT